MKNDVKKLLAIMDEMKSGHLAVRLLSNFENHMGNLSKKDLDKAISIINSKSHDNPVLMSLLDSHCFKIPHLLHEDKTIFVGALNHPHRTSHIKTIEISVDVPDAKKLREVCESIKKENEGWST